MVAVVVDDVPPAPIIITQPPPPLPIFPQLPLLTSSPLPPAPISAALVLDPIQLTLDWLGHQYGAVPFVARGPCILYPMQFAHGVFHDIGGGYSNPFFSSWRGIWLW